MTSSLTMYKNKFCLLVRTLLSALAICAAHGADASSGPQCPPGQHGNTLLTYILQSSSATLVALQDGYNGLEGEFAILMMAPDTLPLTVPYLTNQVGDGNLFQDVLNTTQFLDDWATLSLQADPCKSEFAMPLQCYKEYQDATTETRIDAVPPNAMMRIYDDPSKAILVDIFDVFVAEDGSYVFVLRQAPNYSEIMVPEGQCHAPQSLMAPHYHHISQCMDIILDWNIKESQFQGQGITMFIKIGPK